MEQQFSKIGESDKALNWGKSKDPTSQMYLAGTAVASWSLTQEVAGSSPLL